MVTSARVGSAHLEVFSLTRLQPGLRPNPASGRDEPTRVETANSGKALLTHLGPNPPPTRLLSDPPSPKPAPRRVEPTRVDTANSGKAMLTHLGPNPPPTRLLGCPFLARAD